MANRIMKFRAWDGEQMHTQFMVARPQFADVLSILTDEKFALEQYNKKLWKVMQFTGKTDIKGKDIYEGDILEGWRTKKHNVMKTRILFEVKWSIEKTAFIIYYHPMKWDVNIGFNQDAPYKIIGNIYENESLLSDGKI